MPFQNKDQLREFWEKHFKDMRSQLKAGNAHTVNDLVRTLTTLNTQQQVYYATKTPSYVPTLRMAFTLLDIYDGRANDLLSEKAQLSEVAMQPVLV